MGALPRGWHPLKFWTSTFQWTHPKPQDDLRASHRGPRSHCQLRGITTDTGLASLSGRLFDPPPANRQISRQCPRRGSLRVCRVPRGAPCSLGLWPEDLRKGLLSRGSTAARALPRDLWRQRAEHTARNPLPPTLQPHYGGQPLLAMSTGSPPCPWGLATNLEVLSPAGLAAEEVTGRALEEDHVLRLAACTRHTRCKGPDVSTMGLLHPGPNSQQSL